ncbi:hypothetical protein QBC47DRAFT_388029 [Echria macrotheca]|uniref:Uncharacterized protein n=1 Tax=Echria macrotheca TaxID=438768 RepID=A0AAJ0F9J9_9PEZI|nr:hypothetical protein QBC47DRAFT_388029 [Echria macrotheca]
MLRNIVAVATALLVASAVATPVMEPRQTGSPRPPNKCVLIEPSGDDPGYIIDPFNRPLCACNCLKSACMSVTGGGAADYALCVKTPWPSAENPWSNQLIVAYGTCTGSQHCVA